MTFIIINGKGILSEALFKVTTAKINGLFFPKRWELN